MIAYTNMQPTTGISEMKGKEDKIWEVLKEGNEVT